MRRFVHAAAISAAVLTLPAHADLFGSGANQFEIPFVAIGAPGNAPDTTGNPNPAGRVDYVYQIGKYEVPQEAIAKANAESPLAGNPLNLISWVRPDPQKPAAGLSWTDVAKFVNWLNREVGAPPAYKFDDGPGGSGVFQLWTPDDPGYDPANLFRNRLATYVLPSTDEWYKAAYYDPTSGVYYDYATGSNAIPTPIASGTDPFTAVYESHEGPANVTLAGGDSPFGVVGMSGNVYEFEESAFDLVNNLATERRGWRGGHYGQSVREPLAMSSRFRGSWDLQSIRGEVGFRIARVPEPSTLLMAALLSTGLLSPSRA